MGKIDDLRIQKIRGTFTVKLPDDDDDDDDESYTEFSLLD